MALGMAVGMKLAELLEFVGSLRDNLEFDMVEGTSEEQVLEEVVLQGTLLGILVSDMGEDIDLVLIILLKGMQKGKSELGKAVGTLLVLLGSSILVERSSSEEFADILKGMRVLGTD